MRPLLLLAFLLFAMPALAQGEAKLAMMAPDPACEAPAFVTPTSGQPVQDDASIPPPFRHAMLACTRETSGPTKPRVRRT